MDLSVSSKVDLSGTNPQRYKFYIGDKRTHKGFINKINVATLKFEKINSFKSTEQIHNVDTVFIEGTRRLITVLLPI